jgi:uncharacterized integral membrane protein
VNKLRISVGALVLALVVIVAFQNTEVVTVKVLAWQVSMSRFVLLLLTTAGGVLGGFVAANFVRVMRK